MRNNQSNNFLPNRTRLKYDAPQSCYLNCGLIHGFRLSVEASVSHSYVPCGRVDLEVAGVPGREGLEGVDQNSIAASISVCGHHRAHCGAHIRILGHAERERALHLDRVVVVDVIDGHDYINRVTPGWSTLVTYLDGQCVAWCRLTVKC